jgi:hypothetical protein
MLLSGVVDKPLVQKYPELSGDNLHIELQMFTAKYTYRNLSEATSVLKSMHPGVLAMFKQVETLVRILLLYPVSSCEAERSFSCLRRLKTWLRNSMTQKRLNSLAVCHVHQLWLDKVNVTEVATPTPPTTPHKPHRPHHLPPSPRPLTPHPPRGRGGPPVPGWKGGGQ